MAITGNAANASTQGRWQYSVDGSNWSDVGSVSTSQALLVSAASRLRFVPVDNYNGTPTGLVVRQVDSSVVTTFSSYAAPTFTRATADVSNDSTLSGGTTRYSNSLNSVTLKVSDGDLLGDEVNIAARIQGLAEPGGICLSAKVHAEVQGKVSDVQFVSLGTPPLKNIRRPIEIFALSVKKKAGHMATSSVLAQWAEQDLPRVGAANKQAINPLIFRGYSSVRSGAAVKGLTGHARPRAIQGSSGDTAARLLGRDAKKKCH